MAWLTWLTLERCVICTRHPRDAIPSHRSLLGGLTGKKNLLQSFSSQQERISDSMLVRLTILFFDFERLYSLSIETPLVQAGCQRGVSRAGCVAHASERDPISHSGGGEVPIQRGVRCRAEMWDLAHDRSGASARLVHRTSATVLWFWRKNSENVFGYIVVPLPQTLRWL